MIDHEEKVILVDEHDAVIGNAGKMDVHLSGTLHRALSVFIFNSKGEWLLQKRAEGKYHSAGLWTNACCSHPRAGEVTLDAAHRRLKEEMGLACDLHFLFSFTYRAEVGNGLIEHEFDHVFMGITDAIPQPDLSEASEWKYFTPDEIRNMLNSSPENFTAWFRIVFERVNTAVKH